MQTPKVENMYLKYNDCVQIFKTSHFEVSSVFFTNGVYNDVLNYVLENAKRMQSPKFSTLLEKVPLDIV